jgi:hypothetical protein
MSAASVGLEPAHAELSAALRRQALPEESLSGVLEALCELRLAKRGATSEGHPSFSFVHRRFQEFLATRRLQAEPERVSTEVLFGDYRWREACVVLLQTSSGPFFAKLLADAEATLDEALELLEEPEEASPGEVAPETPDPQEGSEAEEEVHDPWVEGIRYLLELLQEGLRERIDEVPASLREKIGEWVRIVWNSGNLVDAREALEVAGLVPAAELEGLLIFAFDSRSEVLAEEAYRQAAWLRRLPEPVADGIRAMLVDLERSGELSRLWRRTRVHVSRLPESGVPALPRYCTSQSDSVIPGAEIHQ